MIDRFCIWGVIIHSDRENNVENLRELNMKLHSKENVKVNWLLATDVFEKCPELVTEVVKYHHTYGDEVTCDPASSHSLTQEEMNRRIDMCMTQLKDVLGSYPKSVGAWHLNSLSLDYLHKKYGVEIAQCYMWEQLACDGYSGVGGINGPYYPSRNHFLVPAQTEGNNLNIIALDGCGRDFYENKFPNINTGAIHPWDTNCIAGDGLEHQKHLADLFLSDKANRNDFKLLCVRFELDWMNQSFFLYNKQRYMKKRQFAFIDFLYEVYPDVHYATMSEFNSFFRTRHPNNDTLMYRYLEKSKYNPNVSIYWYFCKNYRIAIEFGRQSHEGSETVIKTATDFRRGGGEWYDGYDGADTLRAHLIYSETKVRTTSMENMMDKCKFRARGGKYDVWILSDGTGASDIEVHIDETSIGISNGTRGIDGWYRAGNVELSPGEHIIKLYSRYNPHGEWFVTYAEIILTQEKSFTPAYDRYLNNYDYISTVDFTIYNEGTKEPVPPSYDWGIQNGVNWKLNNPIKEIFIKDGKYLDLTSQETLMDSDFKSRTWGGHIYAENREYIPFNIELVKLQEKGHKTIFEFRVFNKQGDLLIKTIELSPENVVYYYKYYSHFDSLIMTDIFGKKTKLNCPDKLEMWAKK